MYFCQLMAVGTVSSVGEEFCETVLVGEVTENKVIRIKETAVKYVNVIISVDDVRNDLRP